MTQDILRTQINSDPFNLRKRDFNVRVPEPSEMFSKEEAHAYIDGCDYPESVDDLLLVWEVQRLFGPERIQNMSILDALCGPGRLGREFSGIGAKFVVGHDGDAIMLEHARSNALSDRTDFIQSPADAIGIDDNRFDLVICHNSIHQLESMEKLDKVMKEFLRLAKSGGHIIIADYQRASSPEFLDALDERLRWTKPEIVPLLIPTFFAAFSKKEFEEVFSQMSGIKKWAVVDAPSPVLTSEMQERVNLDPVKHILDFSPMSLRVIVKKE